MLKITAITAQTKNKERCNIFIDGEFRCGLSLETVLKYRLKVGKEIEEKEFDAIVYEGEKSQALNKAINYVSNTFKTKKQVKEYLLRKGFDEDIVWYCIDKLKEYNYVNDEEYAKRYLESTSKNQGQRLSEYKLMARGVKKEDIQKASDVVEIDHLENAKLLAEKHLKNKEKTKENILKTYRYLIGRGFSYEDAEKAVDSIRTEK